MTRVKRGITSRRKREKILKYTKGFRWGRKSKERAAKEALLHAWTHAFNGRKEKKRNFRRLWQTQINAATRQKDISYSKFIAGLKAKNIKLDRKVLAGLAKNQPAIFERLLGVAQKSK
ncbi:MAG: 50S ribosomal protein L20 [Candidatus Paceibacterota bacterium]